MPLPSTENTAHAIICDALGPEKACKIARGDDPDSELEAVCVRILNQLINIETRKGRRLWLLTDYAIPLTAGTNVYPLTAVVSPGQQYKPQDIEDQYYLYSAANGGTRRPVWRISRNEWNALSVTNQQGPITQLMVDPQQNALNINTWLTPDANEATGTLHVVLRNQVTNFAGVTDVMNFPAEWAEYLGWALAQRVVIGQPTAIQARCDAMATLALTALDEADEELGTSILPQPDQRMMLPSRFRK